MQESGLTGLRFIAKLIDVAVIMVFIQLLLVPLEMFPSLVPGPELDDEELSQQLELAEDFGDMYTALVDYYPASYLVFVNALTAVVAIAYFFFGEFLTKQTLGKKAFGLRVIDNEVGQMTAGQALARAFMTTLNILLWLWVIDLVAMAVRNDGKSLVDSLAGTRVIRVKKIFHHR